MKFRIIPTEIISHYNLNEMKISAEVPLKNEPHTRLHMPFFDYHPNEKLVFNFLFRNEGIVYLQMFHLQKLQELIYVTN